MPVPTPRPGRTALALVALLVTAITVAAHADVVPRSRAMLADTIVEIAIEDGRASVEFEIGGASLMTFRNILPDELYARLRDDAEPFVERAVRFFGEDFVLRAGAGPPVPARIETIEVRARVQRDEVTGQPVPADEDAPVLFVRATYEFTGRPSTFSITPPPMDAAAATNIGFVTYHGGLAVNDFRYLAQEEIVDLDWEDPWYSRFRNRNLVRYYDSPVMAFLYVEPYEVRKEIVIRPVDVARLTDLDLGAGDVIPAARLQAVKERTLELLAAHGTIRIDGTVVQPKRVYANFIERTMRGTTFVPDGVDVPVTSATLGIIYVYATTGWPDEVTLDWDLFTNRIQRIPGAATDSAGGLPAMITPEDPLLTWKNYLTNPPLPALVDVALPPTPRRISVPVASVVCVLVALGLGLVQLRRARGDRRVSRLAVVLAAVALAAGAAAFPFARRDVRVGAPPPLPEADAPAVAESLLTNVYRAFDFPTEDDVYDTLARSADGEMLGTLYTTIYAALVLQQETGMSVSVDTVDVLDAVIDERVGDSGFSARCTWNVTGSVSHWGHVHSRTSQYEADVTIEPVDGEWKLTALQPRRQERLAPVS